MLAEASRVCASALGEVPWVQREVSTRSGFGILGDPPAAAPLALHDCPCSSNT